MQEEVLLNGPKAMKPSLIGTSDKFCSGMFVTNHFNKNKENIRYIQPSIMQHRITFIGEFYHPNLILHFAKFKYGSMGDGVLQNISCHVARLSWSSLPLWCASLVKSLTSKNLNNHAPLFHHTYACFYLNKSLEPFKLPCSATSMIWNTIRA